MRCRGFDVTVSIDDGRTALAPGGSTTYTVVVANNGPYTANALDIDVAFPAAFTSVEWTVSPDGGARCGQVVGQTEDISLHAARLPPGASCTITAEATLSSAATGKVTVVAAAHEIARCVADTDASNDEATDSNTVSVAPNPDPKAPPGETPDDPKAPPSEAPEDPKADPTESGSGEEDEYVVGSFPPLFDDQSELGGCNAARDEGLWTMVALIGLWAASRRRWR